MRPNTRIPLSLLSVLLVVLVALPAFAKKDRDEELLSEDFAYPPYHGPKKTIAVSKFDATGGFVARYGGWDIGGGLSAMLMGELQKTNRFIVVERADLDAILREQELGLSGVAGSRAPQAGQLLGAQIMIRGSVTEFDESVKGGGLSLGLGLGRTNTSGGRRKSQGQVAIDLRMSDTTTGRIIDQQTVTKTIVSKSMAVEVGSGDLSVGGDRFNNTSLGRATRVAIREAVLQIIDAMEDVPWQGLVARADGVKVYVNAGSNANVTKGQVLQIYRVDNAITDPSTGELLGVEESHIGEVELVTVEPRYSVGNFLGDTDPQIGDVVRQQSN